VSIAIPCSGCGREIPPSLGVYCPDCHAIFEAGKLAASEVQKETIARYEATLRAIAACELIGADFGDWVQAACEDALEGLMPECPNCGTFVHEGPCVAEEPEDAA